LVFEPPRLTEGEPEPQDVVQLHLEHRLVKRLISRFASQGFRSSLGRMTVVTGSGARPRVVLIGRLSLFGPDARRLHEEIIPITAPWRDTRRPEAPLEPFAEAGEATTILQLYEALRGGKSPDGSVIERLGKMVEHDIADLRPYLEARAEASEVEAKTDLTENGRREARAMAELLQRQIDKVREAMRNKQMPVSTPQLDLFGPTAEDIRNQQEKELRQFEADRRSWDAKLIRLQEDLEREPQAARDGYEVRARQLQPLGLVYIWPAQS
jgi:hypothetical protein